MSCGKIVRHLAQGALFIFIIYMISLVILRPASAFNGIFDGLMLCYNRLIPSLFPFIVLSNILIAHPFAKYLGLGLLPYTRCIGIRSGKAATCLILGIIGGFAAGGMLISGLYANGEISKTDAEILLCCTIGSGPAFVINAVGYAMFGSITLGVILFLSQIIASMITGIICSAIYRKKRIEESTMPQSATQISAQAEGIGTIISRCTTAMLSLCGYVICFSCLTSLVLSNDISPTTRYLFCAITELTSACVAAGKVRGGVYLASAALSVMGLCIFMQLRGICARGLQLKGLILSRLIHLPLALAFTYAAMRIIKPAISTALMQPIRELYYRLPADASLVLFLLCVAIICDIEQNSKKHLLARRKEV